MRHRFALAPLMVGFLALITSSGISAAGTNTAALATGDPAAAPGASITAPGTVGDEPGLPFTGAGACLEAKHDRFDAARALLGRVVGPPDPPTNFDVDHYDIDIAVNFGTEILVGDVSITARSLVPALSQVLIDLEQGMAVSSVERAGTALAYSHANDRVTINLDQSFGVGQTFTIRIRYAGHPLEGGLLSFSFDTHNGAPIASSLSEPWFARNWWPCKETPTDKATADIAFTAPASLVAASNGLLVGVDDHGLTKTWHWHTDYPITTYLISVAISNYETFSDTYTPMGGGSMPVDFYVYPEHLQGALNTWYVISEQIEVFRQHFGEYPFVNEKYGMAEFNFGGAMEHQTLTSLGDCCVSSPGVIAHELAHQWFGDEVTCATWHDIWLNEGFATWAEALWDEHLDPGNGYHDHMTSISYNPGFPGSVYRYDLSDPWEIFSFVVYYKGAWVVHMLRGVLGESDFWAGLASYQSTYRHSSATTEDFKNIFEAQSGEDLDWFFDEWVYGENRPDYRYAWVPDTPAPGQMTVLIGQVQTNAPAFTMPIDLDVVTTTGTERFTVWDSQISQSFVLDVTGTPTGLVFDPDDWVLDWHEEYTGVDVGEGTALAGLRPAIGSIRPQPSTGEVAIPFRVPSGLFDPSAPVRMNVYDVGGRLVRVLLDGLPAGDAPGFVTWDGLDRVGARVGGGVYFVKLSVGVGGGDGSDVTRIVRAR